MLVYTLLTVSKSLERVFQDYRIKKKVVSMSGKNQLELGMDFKKTCQGKDKAIKVFFRKEMYLTAEIFIIYFASLLEEL